MALNSGPTALSENTPKNCRACWESSAMPFAWPRAGRSEGLANAVKGTATPRHAERWPAI
eukprot:1906528-Alexandrium_andersonii.AAC.1